MRYWKKCGLILMLFAALTLGMGCAAAPLKSSAVGFYMDTVITFTGYCDEELLSEGLELCGEYEKLLSRTIEGSDVWNINNAGGTPVTVSESTAELLTIALDICEKSGGAMDITVAPAVDLWDFTSGSAILPDGADIAAAAERVDYTKVRLNGNTVTLPAGMAIDLGAVAKGYIADKVAAFFKEQGVDSALLNFGGNVITIGAKPDGSPWRVGIQDPEAPDGESIAVLGAMDSSVVTSGVYQRGFDLDGIRYHHILDAKTGYPLQNGVDSVTIIAESSALCDALSTACFALGENGLAFAESMNAEAVIIYSDGRVKYTRGAEALLQD